MNPISVITSSNENAQKLIATSCCTKDILNIMSFCWDNNVTEELLSSLFGNKINKQEESSSQTHSKSIQEIKEENTCSNTITNITSSSIQQKKLDSDFFSQMFGYNGHINVKTLYNQDYMSNNYKNIVNTETFLKDQDLIIFTVSINSTNLAKELFCLETISIQLTKINSQKKHQVKLIILIDECNTLVYNADNDTILLLRDSNESIKEDDLCSQLINLLKSKTCKLTDQNTFIKISLSKAATYNNFTHDLNGMTEKQITFLGNVICGGLVWNATKPECRVEKLRCRTIELNADEFKYHIQNVNNTGFIKLSTVISSLILDLNSNCSIEHVNNMATKINKFIDLFTTYQDITPADYLIKLAEKKEFFESLIFVIDNILQNSIASNIVNQIMNTVLDLVNNIAKPLNKWSPPNYDTIRFLKYDEMGINNLLIAYHNYNNTIGKLLSTYNDNDKLYNNIKKIITKLSRYLKPKTKPINNYFAQWFQLMKNLQNFLVIDDIVKLVPPLITKVCKFEIANKPSKFLKLTQEQATHVNLNPELFYKFIEMQLSLFYVDILERNATAFNLYNYLNSEEVNHEEVNYEEANHEKVKHEEKEYKKYDLIFLITCHKINKFWNNSLLSHIIDTKSSLCKLNLLASECYRNYKSLDRNPQRGLSAYVLSIDIDMTKIYDMSLEEYLINNLPPSNI